MMAATIPAQWTRPFRVAIKTLLLQSLLPLINYYDVPEAKTNYLEQNPSLFGVRFYSWGYDGHLAVAKALADDNPPARIRPLIEDLKAARDLEQKVHRLMELLAAHPDPHRLPMYRGKSEEQPLPEDVELNDLLLQSRTLEQATRGTDYMILFHQED